jgi:hypothetical protein
MVKSIFLKVEMFSCYGVCRCFRQNLFSAQVYVLVDGFTLRCRCTKLVIFCTLEFSLLGSFSIVLLNSFPWGSFVSFMQPFVKPLSGGQQHPAVYIYEQQKNWF